MWARLADIVIVVVAGYIELTPAQFSEWMPFGVVMPIETIALHL